MWPPPKLRRHRKPAAGPTPGRATRSSRTCDDATSVRIWTDYQDKVLDAALDPDGQSCSTESDIL